MKSKEQKIAELFNYKLKEYSSSGQDLTLTEMAQFRHWMIEYLKTHKGDRHIVLKREGKDKIEPFVDAYIKNSGFTLRPDKTN
jgi:uncharacterized protein YxeA